MSTKEALEALIGGQAFEFRSKIEDELAARSLEAIQTKRFEVGASMFGDEVVEEEFEDLEEGRMPASVIKSKERLASMSDGELAKHHGDKDENALRQMAWRHGYGKMSPHYVNRIKKAKGVAEEVEELDEISKDTYVSAMKSKTMTYDDDRAGDTSKILKRAEREKGKKFAKQLDGIDKDKPHRYGYHFRGDKLAHRQPARVTKSGKANQQDVKTLKKTIAGKHEYKKGLGN
jgi:hypothetical protein